MAAQEVQKLRHEKSEAEMRAQRAEAIGSALLLDLRNGTKDTQLARDYAEGLLTRIESIIHDENSRCFSYSCIFRLHVCCCHCDRVLHLVILFSL